MNKIFLWIILAILLFLIFIFFTTLKNPSDTLSENLPECSGQQFTHSPAELDEIIEIAPLGTVHPPSGHILPIEHTYVVINHDRISEEIVPLVAPGNLIITQIQSNDDKMASGRTEYTILFALCKDVKGYFGHVKELSDELKTVIEDVECEDMSRNPDHACPKNILYEVAAGTELGGVGHIQGIFDFGLFDERTTAGFINPERYGRDNPSSLHKVCPYDYYEASMKEQIYAKIKSDGDIKCGETMQDIPGALQGNWFIGDAAWDKPESYDRQLAFAYNTMETSEQIISIGGIITDVGYWRITPQDSGFVNRTFKDVTLDGNIYCYEGSDESDEKREGSIIVQMITNEQIQVEYLDTTCSEDYVFNTPSIYDR